MDAKTVRLTSAVWREAGEEAYTSLCPELWAPSPCCIATCSPPPSTPLHARQVGVRAGGLRVVVLALVAVSVVVSLQAVGLLMSVALLVTPAATARLVTQRLSTMTLVAVSVGVGAAVGGLTISYHLAAPPAPPSP